MMRRTRQSPWIVVALGLFGLTVGYAVPILRTPDVFARANQCPMKMKQQLCHSGGCSADCPGNCHKGNA